MYERTDDRIQDSGNRQGYCDKSKVDCECPLYAWECLSAFKCMTQKISKKLNIGYSSQSSCFLLIFVYSFILRFSHATPTCRSPRNLYSAPRINAQQMTHVTGSQMQTAKYPFTGMIQSAKITLPISSSALQNNGASVCRIPCRAFRTMMSTPIGGIIGMLTCRYRVAFSITSRLSLPVIIRTACDAPRIANTRANNHQMP